MDRERRAEDRDTRDLAVKADTKIDSHLDDCAQYRVSTENKLTTINAKLDKINWLLPLIIGGIIMAGKVMDYAYVAHSISLTPK